MLKFVLKKMWNKKWFTLCLVFGMSLFVAVCASDPMFESGAEDEILHRTLQSYADEKNNYPLVVTSRKIVSDFSEWEEDRVTLLLGQMEENEKTWNQKMKLSIIGSQQLIAAPAASADSSHGGRGLMLQISMLRNLDNHISVVKSAGDGQVSEQNSGTAIPCLISEKTMDTYHLTAGETLNFSHWKRADGESLTLIIQGIFRDTAGEGDAFWYRTEEDFSGNLFLTEDAMRQFATEYNPENLTCEQALVWEGKSLNASHAKQLFNDLNRIVVAGEGEISTPLISLLQTAQVQADNSKWLLRVLELPFLVLIMLFIYMVTGQLIDREESEIILLRKRGATRWEILSLYLIEAGLLSAVSLTAGILIGMALCKMAAGTDTFLHFAGKDMAHYHFRFQMIFYGLAACVISTMFLVIPAWRKSRFTNRETERRSLRPLRRKKSFRPAQPVWEKFFLDVFLLGLSLYFLYQSWGQSGEIARQVREGESLDPMLFLNESLFVFAGGLFIIRLIGYLIRLIGWLGRNLWGAVMFSSSLQVVRSFSGRWLLSIFLIMTVADGIFDAGLARTVNTGLRERLEYQTGCDLRFQEYWKKQNYVNPQSGEVMVNYTEPDVAVFEDLKQSGQCVSYTKVGLDEHAAVSAKSARFENCVLMGIHTKEFGETARLMDGLNEEHWFYALNQLAEEEEGVILSRNLAENADIKVGDTIDCESYAPTDIKQENPLGVMHVVVVAIVDAFPGFNPYEDTKDSLAKDDERGLVVVNYGASLRTFGLQPYEIWMRLAEGGASENVREQIKVYREREKGTSILDNSLFARWNSLSGEIDKVRSSPLIQITNGLFTMGFLISLVICLVGFLIVWILSIQSRTLQFGVFRAMGMELSGLYRMLIHEHLCYSVLPMAAGGLLGGLASVLFLRILALVYLPERHVIPVHVTYYGADMLWEVVLFSTMVVFCILVLARILKKLRIAEALKMGGDA